MRVTEAILSRQVMSDILGADQRRLKTHMSVSSGKRLTLPSDNPVDVVTALRYRQGISEFQQYLENVRDARDWLDTTDSALDKAGAMLLRVRDLAVTGASTILPAESFQALAKEVDQIRQEIIQVGNISHGDRYVFAGFKTMKPPFTNAGIYQGGGSTEQIVREVGPGVTLSINVTGDEVITPLLDVLNRLHDHLLNASAASVSFSSATTTSDYRTYRITDTAKIPWNATPPVTVYKNGVPVDPAMDPYTISNTDGTVTFGTALLPTDTVTVSGTYSAAVGNDLTALDAQVNNLLLYRAQIGAKVNRLTLAENRLQDVQLNLQKLQSSVEDVDIAQMAAQLARDENAYQVALAAAARIVQATLLDFLR